jgi:outer membrane protein TolC
MKKKHATPFTTLAAVAALATPSTALAADGPASLEGTLRALLADSPAFRTFAVQTSEADANHLASSGAFDTVATASATGSRTLLTAPAGPLTDQGYDQLALGASLATTLRENVSASLSGSAPVLATLPLDALPAASPQITASLTIPLLKLGRSSPLAAEERATGLHASALEAYQRDAESAMVAQIADDYWTWVGRFEQLKLSRALEALAKDQLKDVDELIAHNAKAPVERLPFSAAADNAAATRAAAEQLVVAAGEALREALGLPGPAPYATPTGQLPAVAAAPLDAALLAGRAHQTARERPLLAFLARETRAADARLEGARTAVRPDVSLVAQGTAAHVESYAATTSSPAGYAAQTGLGYYGGVTLQFSMPVQNRAARGARDYAANVDAERRLAASQEANAIDRRIDALSGALATISRTYRDRANAAMELQASYEAERTKFKLGNATGMDVVLAEQQYTNASLALVAERIAYAVTLSDYLHESGALVAATRARDVATLVRQLTTSTP